ncbi:MAG TPA: hypothetical protein V6D29_06115 [Leptolyngbyaceae cyanobacterium]
MNLWLVCFFLLFLGAEGLQWIGQVGGLGEIDLSWTMTVLGGVGLAIASNYRFSRQPISSQPQETVISNSPAQTATAQPLPDASQPPFQESKSSAQAKPSISFEIPKPHS